MPETNLESECGHWSGPENSLQIEYALRVLTEIEGDVLDGFNRLRRGGVEVGGVLFGTRNGETVSIVASRPLACEHALGPGFVLSARDRQALAGLLEASQTDPLLKGLVPLGWYRSNTRSHIHLSPQDLELFDRHFPEPWQIALVLRPDSFAPTKAGFFFREEDGRIRPESSYREFALPARHSPATPQKTDRALLIERAKVSHPGFRAPVVPVLVAQPEAVPQKPLWIAALALGLGALILVWLAIPRTARSRQEPLALTLQDRDGQLRISWNRSAKPILESSDALLEIREGDRTKLLELQGNQLKGGTVLYKRSSGSVDVRMKVGNTAEMAVFVGQPPPGSGVEERMRQVADTPPIEPEPPLRVEPDQQSSKPDLDSEKKEGIPKKLPPKTFLARALVPRRSEPAAVLLQTAPQIASGATPTLLTPLPGNPPAVPAPPVSPPALAPPRAAVPVKTGAVIWTGRLSKNDVLSIDGNRASVGALTGAIPGQPVRIRAYPAELTSDGINVYASGQKYPPGHTEPPAARNGWNKTMYRSDPRIAGALKVVEAPGPKNGWNRLVLRDEGVKLSIILIEWELL